ncbi:MAG: hypothetical protein ACOZQL_12625, partial [Myxococcota bacterium]
MVTLLIRNVAATKWASCASPGVPRSPMPHAEVRALPAGSVYEWKVLLIRNWECLRAVATTLRPSQNVAITKYASCASPLSATGRWCARVPRGAARRLGREVAPVLVLRDGDAADQKLGVSEGCGHDPAGLPERRHHE